MLKVRLNFGLLALLASFILTGCVNLRAVGKFADGAQMLSEASGKFYDSELETDRKLAVMTVDLGAKQQQPECKKKDDTYLTPWDCATKGENLMSEARRNRAAVASLAQYAQSLKEIAEFNDDENVEKSAKELSGNLSAFAKTLDASADVKESALATAITQLAKIYIDLRIRKVVHEKVRLAQPDVSVIVNTLKDDIARQKQRLDASRLNAKATREEWFNTFRGQYQTNQAKTLGREASTDENTRRNFENSNLSIAAGTLVGDELLDKLAKQPSEVFLTELNKAAISCLEAHQAIQNPDLGEKSGAIIKFINDAKTLLSSVKEASK